MGHSISLTADSSSAWLVFLHAFIAIGSLHRQGNYGGKTKALGGNFDK
jgi:hypothetical protein